MKWPKLTTRRIMALVLVLAMALGLGLPAWHVYRTPEFHGHAWIDRLDPEHPTPTYISWNLSLMKKGKVVAWHPVNKVTYELQFDTHIPTSFLLSYWDCLRGNRQHNQSACQPVGTQVELLCELDHPEICHRSKKGRISSMGLPPSLVQQANRLNGEVRDH
jgi:hypothetical protein